MAADRYPEFDSGFFSKYTTLDHYLNKGGFGTVFGPIPWHDIQVAIKLVMLAQGKVTDDFKKGMEAKQQIWTSLEHKNIMRIHSVDLTRLPKAMFIVMEYAAGGTVTETLRSLGQENKLPIDVVTNWSKQIADGMMYLHDKHIVHRDLKSSNILLMEPYNACNTDAMVTLKIADFDDIKEHDHTTTVSFVGTCAYMAPEVLKEERFSKASDVWSFGVVIWEMLSGDIPYKNLDSTTIINKASRGEPNTLIIEQSFSKDYKLLLIGCWKSTSRERLSIQEILSALQRIDLKKTTADRYPEFDSGFFSKYTTLDHYLNKGAFGIVYGPIPWHDKQIAIKQVRLEQGKGTDEFKKSMEAKQQIWTSLEHKNIGTIHSVDLTRLPKAMFIVMDYAAGGSVTETLRSLGPGNKLPIAVVTNWAKQIAEGMLYLHEKQNIVHRDLKSSNILLMEPYNAFNTDATVTLKITDFDEIKEHDHTTTMSFVGTCAYMAPEVLIDQWFSKASDVWSFGVVIWEMLSGDIPYKNLDSTTIFNKVSRGELNELIIEQSFPKFYKLLLNGCWKPTSRERPSIHRIFSALRRIAQGQDVAEIISKDQYKSDPVLIETITTKGSVERTAINGLTILDKELFVVSNSSSKIEVYDSTKLSFIRRFYLEELNKLTPMDIASCSRNKCLYIFDYKYIEESNEILRTDPSGHILKRWSSVTGDDNGWGLSVTYESNVILTLKWQNKLIEYLPDGQLIREINLSDAGILHPWHAIKLTNGNFVINHGSIGDDLHRVCLVDVDGKLKKSFGGKRGSNIELMNRPIHLSVDGNGFVLIADEGNHRVLLLDSSLEFKREVLTNGKHGLQNPRKIILDESTSRVFVAEWGYGGLIKIFQF